MVDLRGEDGGGFQKEAIYFTSRDGLRLHAVERRPARVSGRPVICLPGLTRNARDFTALADALAAAGHRVICVDYRGRGASDNDPDWRNYTPFIEALDVTDLMARAHIEAAHIVGTSRGGLITMILGALRPTALLSVTFNDIGPRIEPEGLARIVGYVGRVPEPVDWADATRIVADINARSFPDVTPDTWEVLARQWFNEDGGRPVAGYDKALAQAVTNASRGAITPELWPQFRSLSRFPMLVVRGANSDLLSEATVDRMQQLHPDLARHLVPGEGHAPLLRDAPTIERITGFISEIDARVARGGGATRMEHATAAA